MRRLSWGVTTKDVYFSCDTETDGPIPGPYSMLSCGMCAFATFDGIERVRLDPTVRTFYRELRPISDQFDPDRLSVAEAGGLSRERLLAEGAEPREAMTTCAEWVRQVAAEFDGRPVFVGYPLGFDWMFTAWYLVAFSVTGSPFGHSSHLDLKSVYAVKADVPVSGTGKRLMPRRLLSTRRHTHHALDDAVEQADLGANLLEWFPGH